MTEHETIDVSLSQIAKQSSLDASLIKYYFGNKGGLFLALLEDVLGPWLAKMPSLLESEFCPIEKLRVYIKSIVAVYSRYPFMSRLIQYTFEDEDLGKRVATSISKPMSEVLRKILDEGVAAGEIKIIDPTVFYLVVLGACDQMFFNRNILRVAFGVASIDDKLCRQYRSSILSVIFDGILTAEHASRKASLVVGLEPEAAPTGARTTLDNLVAA